MKKDRIVPIWLSVIFLTLCAVSMAWIIWMIVVDSSIGISFVISCVFSLCATILAIIYCFMGYKKNAAKFFKIFSVVLALVVLLQINHYMTSVSSTPPTTNNPTINQNNAASAETDSADAEDAPKPEFNKSIPKYSQFLSSIGISDKITIPVLTFALLVTLTIAKDLGKKKSYLLIGLAFAFSLISLIIGFIGFKDSSIINRVCSSGIEFSIIILCAIYGVMIYAKYQDKAERGTK